MQIREQILEKTLAAIDKRSSRSVVKTRIENIGAEIKI